MMSTSLPGYHILHCEVIFRGSIPWWQLLRGSVERSSASASLLYLPLFLLVKVSKESSYSSDNSDEEEEKASKTPQKSRRIRPKRTLKMETTRIKRDKKRSSRE
ncbi:uncharacterized protein LOC130943668 isoform X3 [Arachis stenosperma]|uniref:uncharacterized protein LOC130943668 isoform X3 n=1 Tax=Arachis stenosperma TaxID=217475 RepID=UPI0025AD0CEA|nr:uncharacterized protein LOC130943668 isoform X3 [Arachis stenosperma]